MDIIDPIQCPEWDVLVQKTPDSTIFHTSYWARTLRNSYNYHPLYLVQFQHGKITTLVPVMEVRSFLTGTRGVSLPFTDYCEPIMGSQSSWKEVMDCLIAYGRKKKWTSLEMRGGSSVMGTVQCSSQYYRHRFALAGNIDLIYRHLKSSIKRNIRKAESAGVVITHEKTPAALNLFYTLHCETRKKHGVPPQPFHFFQHLLEHVIDQNHGQIVTARYEGKIVAAAIYLHFNDHAVYKYGASDDRYLHIRPNDLLMWEAIKWYCNSGYNEFCFGRTDLDNAGLRQFKSGWGGKEERIQYYTYDFSKNDYQCERSVGYGHWNVLFTHMPIPLLKAVGTLLYKHMG